MQGSGERGRVGGQRAGCAPQFHLPTSFGFFGAAAVPQGFLPFLFAALLPPPSAPSPVPLPSDCEHTGVHMDTNAHTLYA